MQILKYYCSFRFEQVEVSWQRYFRAECLLLYNRTNHTGESHFEDLLIRIFSNSEAKNQKLLYFCKNKVNQPKNISSYSTIISMINILLFLDDLKVYWLLTLKRKNKRCYHITKNKMKKKKNPLNLIFSSFLNAHNYIYITVLTFNVQCCGGDNAYQLSMTQNNRYLVPP